MSTTRNNLSESRLPKHLFVVGLGQIGGSFILASQKNKIFQTYSGWDVDSRVNRHAQRRLGIRVVPFDERPPETDLIILATPVHHMHHYIEQLRQSRSSPLVMDLGSTKVDILSWIHRHHRRTRFIGGHPMAGTEHIGHHGWNAQLFSHRYFFLSLMNHTNRSKRDLELIKTIIKKINAIPIEVDPQEHDRTLAYTSHLPYLLATTLVSACWKKVTKDHLPFIGTGFESGTRLAASSPEMMIGILQANKKNIQMAFERYEKISRRIQKCLENDDWEGLSGILKSGQKAKRGYQRKNIDSDDSLFY
ncbi:MAG: prephenate dehydrogenase [bacterium]